MSLLHKNGKKENMLEKQKGAVYNNLKL